MRYDLVGPGELAAYEIELPATEVGNLLRAPQPLLALPPCLLRLPAPGDVSHDTQQAAVGQLPAEEFARECGAILTAESPLVLYHRLACQALHLLGHALDFFGDDHVGHRQLAKLIQRVAKHLKPGLIGVAVSTLCIG